MEFTDEQVRQFNEAGAVTIDTPLTEKQIADAGAAMDRLLPFREGHYRVSRTCDYDDPAIVDIIQHPFFEAVACRVLETEQVHFFQTAILNAYPEPGVPFSFWQHVDIQYRRSDFEASPKRILCSFFLWLTDVNEKRAPMMVRPGSHLLLAEHNEHAPQGKDGSPPRVAPMMLKDLPDLPFADPIPLTARAGQVSVLTTATVHGASTNIDTELRRNLVFTFTAAGVTIGLPEGEEQQMREYHAILRNRLRPDRAHILPAVTAGKPQ
jgi:ectoine hydroxylase-related dioxygenase (phytanoyl-CoA dioxygenase family)